MDVVFHALIAFDDDDNSTLEQALDRAGLASIKMQSIFSF